MKTNYVNVIRRTVKNNQINYFETGLLESDFLTRRFRNARVMFLLCPPSHREVGTCWFTLVRSVCLTLCVCVSHAFMFSAFYLAGSQTRDVDPMLG